VGEALVVRIVYVAADERDGDVTFLRTVQDGPTDRSYGIHVADLAGIPTPVVDRARTVLDRLRDEKAIEAKGSGDDGPTQVVFDLDNGQLRGADEDVTSSLEERFGENTEAVLEAIVDLDVASTAPLELMSTVQEWQRRLETGKR
ncbi:MAG: MutS-related protein, partial [Salinarchaeum sp.]